jgi:hypothetical protein
MYPGIGSSRHVTRIQDVIMLEYPLKVRPMPGISVQSVPVIAIPWGCMNTEQLNDDDVFYLFLQKQKRSRSPYIT